MTKKIGKDNGRSEEDSYMLTKQSSKLEHRMISAMELIKRATNRVNLQPTWISGRGIMFEI